MNATSRPNVIVIMSDEQRWDSLGANGNAASRTPHLDQLAAGGTSMDACFATYPLCCPSRMSIWTGLMPHDHHGFGNWRLLREDLRDQGLIHPFVAASYHTIYNGKWHVPGSTPARFGFTDVEATPAVLNGLDRGRYIEPYRDFVTGHGYELVPGHIENLTQGDLDQLHRPGRAPYATAEIALEHYLEPWQTGLFLNALDRRTVDQPFFAVCSYNAPHFPMIVPEPYDRLIDPDVIELSPNFCAGIEGKPREVLDSAYFHDWPEHEWRQLIAHYLGFCALVDDQVGSILDHLDRSGLLENTIVVFTSDHGDMMGSHALDKKGYPLHYDEALRVPLVAAGPGIEPRQRNESLVSLLDLVPTLADLCGVELPSVHEGLSFAPALRGDQSWIGREQIISESFAIHGNESGTGDAVDPAAFDPGVDGANVSIRTHEHRYIYRLHDHDELYDLQNDPFALVNIADEPAQADRIGAFRDTIAESLASTFPAVAERVRAYREEEITAPDQPSLAARKVT